MTAPDAHLHDDTLRHAITRWHERISIRGERIALPAAGTQEKLVDERPHRARPPGRPERLLRPAAGSDLPAPKRLPQLRQLPELYPEVVDAPEAEGGVPSRLTKTDRREAAKEGTPWRMFAGSPSGRSTTGSRSAWTSSRARALGA